MFDELTGVFQQRNLEGYVGFANLPNQVYRKSVKRGFEFTLMVVGKSQNCVCARVKEREGTTTGGHTLILCVCEKHQHRCSYLSETFFTCMFVCVRVTRDEVC